MGNNFRLVTYSILIINFIFLFSFKSEIYGKGKEDTQFENKLNEIFDNQISFPSIADIGEPGPDGSTPYTAHDLIKDIKELKLQYDSDPQYKSQIKSRIRKYLEELQEEVNQSKIWIKEHIDSGDYFGQGGFDTMGRENAQIIAAREKKYRESIKDLDEEHQRLIQFLKDFLK